jgi:hypothetical protein
MDVTMRAHDGMVSYEKNEKIKDPEQDPETDRS